MVSNARNFGGGEIDFVLHHYCSKPLYDDYGMEVKYCVHSVKYRYLLIKFLHRVILLISHFVLNT